MNILLTGSNGFIGRHILSEFLFLGHTVTACVRKPQLDTSQIKYVVINFNTAIDVEGWLPLLKNIDLVINAVGIICETKQQKFSLIHEYSPIALFEAALLAGVNRVIQISALGADEYAKSQYHLSKQAADNFLQGLPLDWFILRPSLVYGSGAKSMGFFRALSALPVVPLIDNGKQELQPIHISDLVDIVKVCVSNEVPPKIIIDVVGPDVITVKELLLKQRSWLGLNKLKTTSIPYHLALKLMPLTRWLDDPTLNNENIQMLQQGNIANVATLKSVCRVEPKSMNEVLEISHVTTAEYWYASLYFMRPLLRVGLAFVWVWTAIVSVFFYPDDESYQLLENFGIEGVMLPVSLYGAALVDLVLGVGMFFYSIQKVLLAQIIVILAYTVLISIVLPQYWLHPFGEITKNIPMLLATLVLYKMESR